MFQGIVGKHAACGLAEVEVGLTPWNGGWPLESWIFRVLECFENPNMGLSQGLVNCVNRRCVQNQEPLRGVQEVTRVKIWARQQKTWTFKYVRVKQDQ